MTRMRSLGAVIAALAAVAMAVFVLTMVAALAGSAPADAQGVPSGTLITVNTADDENNADADCSLREAIQAANANQAVDACPAGSATEEDAIGFDLGTSVTVTLGSQLPSITDAAGLAIDGGEADLAINGQGDDGPDRAFWVDSGAKLALNNLTVNFAVVYNGSGGAIYNGGGEVRVTQSTFSDNRAGEVDGGGGGGAIYNDGGNLTVSDSTFSGNATFGVSSPGRVEGGGAIHNSSGTLTVSNSTFSRNVAEDISSSGGGILDVGGLVTVTNSTFVGNNAGHAGGGGIAFWETPLDAELGKHHRLINSTLSGNVASTGSNIYCNTHGSLAEDCGYPDVIHLQLRNTIVANSASNPNCNYMQLSDGGHNISDDNSCGFQVAKNSLSNTDPLLDPNGLQDNGGPTKTIALQSTSPAIDAIPYGAHGCGSEGDFSVTEDQRGVDRPQGPACDVGAFEAPPDETAPVLDPNNTESVDPDNMATEVRRDITPTATFSEEMDPNSLTTSTTSTALLYQWNAKKKTWLSVPVKVSVQGDKVTLDPYPDKPKQLLAAKTSFKVTFTTGAKDKAGNALAQETSWTFTTGGK